MPRSSLRQSVTRVTMRTYHTLRHQAQDSGLLPASTDYTRFLCVGNPRTGSTLLMRSLNNHSRIVGYGEIVKDIDRYPGHYHEFGNGETIFQRDPAAFLETRVFCKYPPIVDAVGFKIFYHHAPRDTAWGQAVWDYVLGQPNLKILHLKRHNLLKVFLSRKKARRSGEYIKYSNDVDDAMELDPDEAREFFEYMRASEAEYDVLLSGRPLMEVIYEELSRDYDGIMRDIQSFLGVNYEDVKHGTEKRHKRSLASQIKNYAELKDRFLGSPWESFFTE